MSKRVVLDISDDVYEKLEQLSQRNGSTVIAVFQEAIALKIWAESALEAGNDILVGQGKVFNRMILPGREAK